jgi:Mor family transcriptional regulator
MMSRGNKDSVVPEVVYFMEPDHIMRLVEIFGGQHVYIPTPQELSKRLSASLAAYYRNHHGMEWDEIENKLGISRASFRPIQRMVEEWEVYMEKEIKYNPRMVLKK